MSLHYELFVIPRDGLWHLEIEDDTRQREVLRTFGVQGAAVRHGHFLARQLRETGDEACLRVFDADGTWRTITTTDTCTLH